MSQTERHTAVVAETNDPEQRGRIRVRCAGILGSEDAILRHWVEPCLDWGFFLVPDVDEVIEIEVASSSSRDEVPGQSFLDEPNFRYRGKRFNAPGVVNEFFTEANYAKRRGFATPAGHVLMFDDTDDARKVNLVWHSGDGKYAMLSLDEDGSVILASKTGAMLYLNAKDGELALIDEHGNSYSSSSSEVKIIDVNSNIISLSGTTIQILSQSAVTVSCKDAVIDAGKVQLGGQPLTEPMVLGLLFQTLFSGHIHPTGVGPSGPPTPGVPIPVANVLSTTVFGKL